ncbi:hypothetical protein FEM03_23950 [Phragmitibacter flavus]|uniref:Uncharacterized protein n=1 Tax=Phragmitibacter flavus TaxID=2576071 RepID=A0A5R8K765_9BACT|nr:hypothetical protein [Phragmitibacter flavus]TLD68214.1 hypothetical protein FEM03_23950 [Phragmitibacter flavus]
MKRLLPLLAFAPALLSAQTATEPPAAAATATPKVALTADQMANLTKQLDQIEETITKNRDEALGTALSQFRSAAGSEKAAVDLYLSCEKLVEFDRKDRKTTDFQVWKDNNAGMLSDPEFGPAIKLQIEYTLLSLQAQQVEEIDTLIAPLQAFLGRAVGLVQENTKHTASGVVEAADSNKKGNAPRGRQGGQRPAGMTLGILQGGGNRGGGDVKSSVFSRAYQLENYFTRQDWEYVPLNIAGIYSKVILPFYLENKPAEFSAQWDMRINTELSLRKALQSETEFQVYYKQNYPQLVWAKSQSLFSNSINSIQALADMLKIIRENPTHPNASAWVKQLRENVNQVQPTPASPALTEPAAAAVN